MKVRGKREVRRMTNFFSFKVIPALTTADKLKRSFSISWLSYKGNISPEYLIGFMRQKDILSFSQEIGVA